MPLLQPPDRSPTRTFWNYAIATAFGLLGALGAYWLAPLNAAEKQLRDIRISLFSHSSGFSREVAVVAITDKVVERFDYISPIDRSYLAALIREIGAKNPAVIALDVIIDRKTPHDTDLASAIAGASFPVVVAVEQTLQATSLCNAAARLGVFRPGTILPDLPNLRLGDATLCADRIDGVVRHAGFVGSRGFAAQAVLAVRPRNIPSTDYIPIKFATSPEGTYPFQVLDGSLDEGAVLKALPENYFAGKIVLIGSVSRYYSDWHETPLRFADVRLPNTIDAAGLPRSHTPGVIIQATVVQQLLEPRAPARGGAAPIGPAVAAAAGVLLASLVAPLWFRLALIALAVPATIVAGFAAFAAFNWILPILPMAAAGVGGATAFSFIRERHERAVRRFVTSAFKHFVAPEVVDALVQDSRPLTRRAEAREISVLFTDVEGFCAFVETHPPEVVQRCMNAYFDAMSRTIADHRGTIDKFVGDAIHVIFSAPLNQPDHKERALRCALALKKTSQDLRRDFVRSGAKFGRTRIGGHSGEALVGNFGGSDRIEYTAHGTTINLASRLESANKTLGTTICVSAALAAGAPSIRCLRIGSVILKGFAEPAELLEPTTDDAFADCYDRMMAALASDSPNVAEFECLSDHAEHGAIAKFQLARKAQRAFDAPIHL